MKKLIFFVGVLTISFSAFGQFHAGINAAGLFPLSTMNNLVDFGYGPVVETGYQFKNQMDVSIGYEHLFFNSMLPDHVQKSGFADIKYGLKRRGNIPYAGLRTSYIHSSHQIMGDTTLKEENLGLSPFAGILFESAIFDQLNFDTRFSYTKIFNKQKHQYLKVEIGLRYDF